MLYKHRSGVLSPDRLEVGWAVLYFFVFCFDLDLCWWENTIPLFVVFHMYGMVTWRAKSLGCWDTMLYKHRSGVPSPDRLERGAGQFSAFLFSAWIWLLVPILLTPNLYFWWCHWHCAGLLLPVLILLFFSWYQLMFLLLLVFSGYCHHCFHFYKSFLWLSLSAKQSCASAFYCNYCYML